MKNRTKKAMRLLYCKNGFHIGIIALVLPLLAACSAGDSPTDMPQGTIPIGFNTSVEQIATRVGETTTTNLTSMGVYTYYTGSNNLADSDKPNFMCNQEVSRSGNSSPWTYAPVKYWPNNLTDKLSFYAYGPYNAKGLVVSDATRSGAPYIEYTIQPKEADQVDLVIATPLKDQTYTKNNGKVNLEMNHALTRVDIYATNVDKVADMQITDFAVTGMLDGKRTLAHNEKWSFLSDESGDVIAIPSVTCVPTKLPCPLPASDAKTVVASFFLMRNIMGYRPTFRLTYTSKGSASKGEPPVQTVELKSQQLPSPTTWTEGAHVSYNFKLEKKKVTVTASTHPTWNDAGTGTITGNVVITYAVNPSDPDWGNGGSGSVNGIPVATHSEEGDTHWEEGSSEIVEIP